MNIFQLPELYSISGDKLTGDESLEELVHTSLCNSCPNGAKDCVPGSGS